MDASGVARKVSAYGAPRVRERIREATAAERAAIVVRCGPRVLARVLPFPRIAAQVIDARCRADARGHAADGKEGTTVRRSLHITRSDVTDGAVRKTVRVETAGTRTGPFIARRIGVVGDLRCSATDAPAEPLALPSA